MARFEFPQNPGDNATTTNDLTGVTYIYDLDSKTWSVAGTSAEDNFATAVALTAEQNSRISADNLLDGRVASLENSSSSGGGLTYQIGTDKVMRYGEPAIELVGSDNSYTNVKFAGTAGIAVTSDLQSIIIDGSSITSRVDILELQNPILKKSFNVANRDGIATIRDGEMSVDAQSTNNINFISIGPTSLEGVSTPQGMVGDTLIMSRVSDGEAYRFTITGGAPGLYGVNQVDGLDATITLTSYYVEIFPASGPATNLENYYNRTEIDNKLENADATSSRELALSLISGLKIAVTLATDFQDLREKMLLKLSEIEIAATLES
jgi:hypothetical protein